MSGLLRRHKTVLVVLAALLTFALSAASGFGWTQDQTGGKEQAGEHAGKEKSKGKDESKGHGEAGEEEEGEEQGKEEGENHGKGEEHEKGEEHGKGEEKGEGGPGGPGGPAAPGPVTGQVNSNITNTVTTQITNQVTTNVTPTPVQVKSQAGSLGEGAVRGEQAQGGPGPEVAQVETGQQGGQPTQGRQPAELASTGVNAGALALIGALCIGASLLLFRRRHAA
jgi:LPXTG-motif cell wall-anchored protein